MEEKRLKINASVEITDGKILKDIDNKQSIISDSVKVPERVQNKEKEINNDKDEMVTSNSSVIKEFDNDKEQDGPIA